MGSVYEQGLCRQPKCWRPACVWIQLKSPARESWTSLMSTAGTGHSTLRAQGSAPSQIRCGKFARRDRQLSSFSVPLHDRVITCERGALHRADGSARWTQDSSSVLAAVYGPRQVQIRKEDAERAVVEVVFKPRSGFQGERHACSQ